MKLYHLPQAPKGEGQFCRTPSATDMLRVVAIARELPAIGVIVGAPGVGKTTTLRWYAGENSDDVAYCVMNPAQSSMSQMLARVAKAIGLAADRTVAGRLHGEICRFVRDRALQALLIDEAQHLEDRSLDELRCIHDQTRLPIVFAGNESLRARVTTESAAAFAQFTSRIGPRLEVKSAGAEDVAAMAGRYGITDELAVAWLAKRCTGTGGLRIVSRLVSVAKGAAGKEPVRLSHLQRAASILGGAS